jgi:OMF family outer membrane factor
MQKCIDTAKVYNKNLQINANNIALSSQRHKEAVANLIPKINAVGEYKYYAEQPTQLMPMSTFGGMDGKFKETQFGVPHNINANFQISMPLFNPQILGAIQTTRIASELSTLQYRKSEEQLLYEISNLYYNAQILQNQIIFIDSNILNINKLLADMRLLKEQLMVKTTDVNKVKLQFDQLISQKELVSSKYNQVLNALKFSMGIPQNQMIATDKNIQYEKSVDYSNASTVDLNIMETQNRILSSELLFLKYSRLPSVSMSGAYGTTGLGYDVKPNDFLKFYPVSFVGVPLQLPIFNGTVTHRKINQKKIEVQNSNLQLSLIAEQNQMLIENAKRQRAVAQKMIETMLLQLKLAQEVYEQTVIQQKEGTASLTDVLLADNVLRESQQAYLSVIIDYMRADLELKKATGNITINN